ncbi:hypothetical protein M433DRAFT_29277, partial [Acidomyces richmondensis BFW]
MHSSFTFIGFALGASAAVLSRNDCCFTLTASGGANGAVGQLSDGQNRIGLGGSAASFCISNGAITDSSGRGCILTAPTSQFQCDTGATPQSGFSVGNNGELEYEGNVEFYACPASTSQYNIYTTPVSGQQSCTKITLSTGGKCSGSSSGVSASTSSASFVQSAQSQSVPPPSYVSSSTPSTQGSWMTTASLVSPETSTPAMHTSATAESCEPVTVTVTSTIPCEHVPISPTSSEQPATSQASLSQASYSYTSQIHTVSTGSVAATTGTVPASSSASACQTSLTGPYQTPHLIVPISSSASNQAYGTSYNGEINSTTSTIFNFDIPQSYSGKACSIIFLFPELSQLETSSYTFSGTGSIKFSELSSAASEQTTWNNRPSVSNELNTIAIHPGNSYVVSTEDCKAGMTESIMLSSEAGLSLNFFEDWNPSPLGLYITSC